MNERRAGHCCYEAGTKSNNSQLGAEEPAKSLQLKANEYVKLQSFPMSSSQNSHLNVYGGGQNRPVGKKFAKTSRKRDDEKCPYDDNLVLQNTITLWRNEFSRQMKENKGIHDCSGGLKKE
jgi:hypothetical protein